MSLDQADLKRYLRKRESTDDTDAEGSWAISYGDMITLLLTFFILFFNIDTKKQEKTHIQQAIIAEFAQEKGSAPVNLAKETPKMSIGDKKDGELEENTVKEWGGVLHREGDKVVVEFPSITFYNFGKVEVRKESIAVLEAFAKKYTKFAGTNYLSVKAFTDSVKVTSTERFHDNLELSALRAIAAMRVLQHAGIPLDRMKISGHGETLTRSPANEPEDAVQSTTPSRFVPKPDELARKVILVIEPFTKEKL